MLKTKPFLTKMKTPTALSAKQDTRKTTTAAARRRSWPISPTHTSRKTDSVAMLASNANSSDKSRVLKPEKNQKAACMYIAMSRALLLAHGGEARR